ncbi:type IV pilin protein [Halanaerobium sp.]|jgi:general secretion pathway protein G|uniref:type IV pilin protein n=1 Tax=Halanaerobium sp. TaxID=1895664 RepID=UPI000DE73325|nr:pilin [Halanaerobium sp.]PUU92678.1 MAG: Tfp pilus assembly protein, major pilin PilA [Halanaerobium sp.]
MQKIRNLFKHEEGFTLIELLVVIAVLGILAAIAIPRLGGVTDKAKMTEAVSAMGSIKTALEMNAVEKNGYPGDGDNSTGEFGNYTGETFPNVIDQYLDNYDTADNTWGDWTVTYTHDADEEFTITMEKTEGDKTLTVQMIRSGGSYSDATTSISG